MPKRDVTFVRKGETLPRNKQGDKPGYYPERHLVDPDLRPRSAHPMFGGKAKRVQGGYVQATYTVPASAPVHWSRDTGRLESGVYHKWTSSDSKGKVGRVSKGKVVSKGTDTRVFTTAVKQPKTVMPRTRIDWSEHERAVGFKSVTSMLPPENDSE